jgi:GR25 family glycosyltransferase involved in LPS biosynthesis
MKLGKAINEAFGHVYVKNIAEATRRLESFTNTAQIIDLDYEVFKAIRGTDYVFDDYVVKFRPELYPSPHNQYLVGNYCTTLAAHLDAMRHNYDSYVICDDDVVFHDISCESFADKLPLDWDVIVLGDDIFKHQQGEVNLEKTHSVTFNRMQNIDIAGCHCVAFNKSIYWTMMQYCFMSFDSNGRFGDVTVGDMTYIPNIFVYQASPNICHQERVKLKPYTIE